MRRLPQDYLKKANNRYDGNFCAICYKPISIKAAVALCETCRMRLYELLYKEEPDNGDSNTDC